MRAPPIDRTLTPGFDWRGCALRSGGLDQPELGERRYAIVETNFFNDLPVDPNPDESFTPGFFDDITEFARLVLDKRR